MSIIARRLNKNEVNLVVYHKNCPDGFGGAFAAWYCNKARARKIYFKPDSHNKDHRSVTDDFYKQFANKHVCIVDFSYPYEILRRIIEVARSFIILDHHKTAQESLSGIPDELKIFDMNRSGAVIAWNFFMEDVPVPKFLLHIQDRDLWNNSMENTEEFITYFHNQTFYFNLWEGYIDDAKCEYAIEKGRSWLEYKGIIVAGASDCSRIIQVIDGKYAVVAYSPCSIFISEIGHEAFKKYPLIDFFTSCVYNQHKKSTHFSLRANDNIDVSELAQRHSGGGHPNASGCRIAGLHGILPYPQVDDSFIGVLEKFKVEHIEDAGMMIDIPYILFDCMEFGETFFNHPDQLFIDLIHRKFENTSVLVLQIIKRIPERRVSRSKTDNAIPRKKYYTPSYHIFHNPHFKSKGICDRIPIKDKVITNSIVNLGTEIATPGDKVARHCLKCTLLSLFSA